MKYLIKSTQSIISRGFASTASNASNKKILAGAILSRIPQITPTPTGFEKAYLDHCHKLSKRESLPFPADLYFKKGTVNERRWKEKLAQEEQGVEAAVEEENNTDINNIFNTYVKKNSRITEADKKNDIKSLERKLDQFLYLIVKNNNEWQFPNTEVKDQPALDQAAYNHLLELAGDNMDIWMVGRSPLGHVELKDKSNVFLMKSHIFAGEVQLNSKIAKDFAWVTKDELTNYFQPEYLKGVEDLLSN